MPSPNGSNPFVAAGLVEQFMVDPSSSMRECVEAIGAATRSFLPVVGTAAALAAAAGLAVLAGRARSRVALRRGSRVVTILVPPEVDSAGAETLWRNLHDLLRSRWRRALCGQPHLGFEYHWSPDGLALRMWVPAPVPPGLVERAIESAWPGARTVTETTQQPSLSDSKTLVSGRLRLALPGWWPLRTDHDADPLRSLLGAAGAANGGEAVVQVLARPAGQRAVSRCRRAARDIRRGKHPSRLARVLDLLLPTTPRHRPLADPTIGPDVRAVLNKAESPLWAVDVRYAVTGDMGDRPALRGRAHALASAFAVHAGRNRFVRRRLCRAPMKLGRRAMSRGDLLSTSELAAIAHLPLDRIVPGVSRAGARAVPAPPAVARRERDGKVLGDSDAGPARPVVLRPADARYHLHVLGSTGSGKSTLLTRLILDDVTAGRGVVVIDPKGDLVADVLERVDRHRVVLLDPSAADGRPALNVLERSEGVGDDLVVDHLVGILSRIFEHHWGPRLEDALRSACLTLLRRDGAMLSDVPRILTARGEWQMYLADSASEELAGFWKWYEALNDGQRAQVVGPLLYKLRAFLLRPAVREIVNAPKSDLDVADILNRGKLLLVRVPKGTLGEDTSRLLGSFVVAKVWQAATARAAVAQDKRRDASVFVDECQNFVTTLPRSFDEVLAEARGYRVSFVLAHQHLSQLPRDLRDSVSANARNKVFFTVSPEDAFVLARHTSPNLTDHDLANLAAYQAAVRLVVDGQDQPAFTMRTRPTEAAF